MSIKRKSNLNGFMQVMILVTPKNDDTCVANGKRMSSVSRRRSGTNDAFDPSGLFCFFVLHSVTNRVKYCLSMLNLVEYAAVIRTV